MRGPGIADADRARGARFASLFDAIGRDSEALDALALADAALEPGARRSMARAVVEDLSEPGVALGALLAVEEDATLARELARLLARFGVYRPRATLRRGEHDGEATLVQRRFGFALERMRVAWKRNDLIHFDVEPINSPSDPEPTQVEMSEAATALEPTEAALGPTQVEMSEAATALEPTEAETSEGVTRAVSVQEAVEEIAPRIWRHVRRGGSVPEGADRFAGFFSLG